MPPLERGAGVARARGGTGPAPGRVERSGRGAEAMLIFLFTLDGFGRNAAARLICEFGICACLWRACDALREFKRERVGSVSYQCLIVCVCVSFL